MSDELLSQVYDLIKSGDKLTARNMLSNYLRDHQDDETGWSLLYYCVSRSDQKRQCLERVLQINPENQKAQDALARLEKYSGFHEAHVDSDNKSELDSGSKPEGQGASLVAINAEDKQGRHGVHVSSGLVRWLLIAILLIIIFTSSYLIFNKYIPPIGIITPSPTAIIAAVQNSLSPSLDTTFFPSNTPTYTSTSGPPPTEVLAPTAVVITFTPLPTNTPTITPIPSATLPPGAKSNVQILDIFYYGNQLHAESDEYIVIGNIGNAPQDVSFWKLEAVSRGSLFTFPKFTLQAGQSCQIYTNEIHEESCGFSFQNPTALWNNRADCARLYNERGNIIDEFCYNRE